MPALKAFLPVGACLTIAAISGCGKPLNFEPDADALYIPDRPTQAATASTTATDTDGDISEQDEPQRSVLTLDRSGWGRTVITVPNRPPQHQAHFTGNLHDDTTLPRQAGRFPTAASAADLPTYANEQNQVREALFAPFVAIGDIVLFLPRAVATPPLRVSRAGLNPYERVPRGSSAVHSEPVIPILPPQTDSQ